MKLFDFWHEYLKFVVDVQRQVHGIISYSGRLGGKPFLASPYSLSVPNIGKSNIYLFRFGT